jgi:hypothetical protein
MAGAQVVRFARGRVFDPEPSPRGIDQMVHQLTAAVDRLASMIAQA